MQIRCTLDGDSVETLKAGRKVASGRRRQADFQYRAPIGPIGRMGLSTVGVGDGTDHAQPQAAAAGLTRTRRLAAPEALERSLGAARRKAGATVEHTQHASAAC